MTEQTKFITALQAYQQGRVDLRGGAMLAGVSYNQFMQAVQANRLVILGEDGFLERLGTLAEQVDSPTLREVVKEMSD